MNCPRCGNLLQIQCKLDYMRKILIKRYCIYCGWNFDKNNENIFFEKSENEKFLASSKRGDVH